MTRVQRDSISYLVIIGFCIYMLVSGIPAHTPEYPGYGAPSDLVPKVATFIMLFMACLSLTFILIAHFLNKPLPPDESEFPEESKDGGGFTQIGRIHLWQLLGVIIPSVLLVIVIEYLGYIISSLIYLMCLQYIIGSRRWVTMIVLSVALTTALYIIMRYGFGVPVPGPVLFE